MKSPVQALEFELKILHNYKRNLENPAKISKEHADMCKDAANLMIADYERAISLLTTDAQHIVMAEEGKTAQ